MLCRDKDIFLLIPFQATPDPQLCCDEFNYPLVHDTPPVAFRRSDVICHVVWGLSVQEKSAGQMRSCLSQGTLF